MLNTRYVEYQVHVCWLSSISAPILQFLCWLDLCARNKRAMFRVSINPSMYIPCVSIRFQKDGMTLGCLVAALNCWRWLIRKTTGELSSVWNSDLFTRVLGASFQCKALMHAFFIHLLDFCEQSEYIAATKLAWTQWCLWKRGYWTTYEWYIGTV